MCRSGQEISVLSRLNAAVPMCFAKNMQHRTSQVLWLPRKIDMGMSEVLRLPGEMKIISRSPKKSIAPVRQNDL